MEGLCFGLLSEFRAPETQLVLKGHVCSHLSSSQACWGGMLFGFDTGAIGGVLRMQIFKE
jgi:hypothetical protein